MEKLTDGSDPYKNDILMRLRRIEGQVKGIQKMMEDEKACIDILTQVAAVRSAINKVGGLVLERYSGSCMQNMLDTEDRAQSIKELTDTIQKFLKFVD